MFIPIAFLMSSGCNIELLSQENKLIPTRRTPAEWEPQEAIWLQWPSGWEGPQVAKAFSDIVTTIAEYEHVHILVKSETLETNATAALEHIDQDHLSIHRIPFNSSWIRDNGPRYVDLDGQLTAQNWNFNGWNLPNVPFEKDNNVPIEIAEMLEIPLEHVDLVHERGDLEVNGTDTALVSWSVLSDRNPHQSKESITNTIKSAHGVSSVVYIEGYDPEDLTLGHVDGIARFVSEDTVVVGQDGSLHLDSAAEQIATQRPDLTVVRLASERAPLFMNWLVGNGFVLVGDSQNDTENAIARELLELYFPERNIHFVNVDGLWENGGGVHCVTNDQPLLD